MIRQPLPLRKAENDEGSFCSALFQYGCAQGSSRRMKYDIQFTNQFKKDLKLAKKQNKNLDKLFEVIDILANGGTLDAKYRDHDLTGNYKGTRECHI